MGNKDIDTNRKVSGDDLYSRPNTRSTKIGTNKMTPVTAGTTKRHHINTDLKVDSSVCNKATVTTPRKTNRVLTQRQNPCSTQNLLMGAEKAMDNDQMLEKYIDKVDREQTTLRQDIRISERNTSERISTIEERMDTRLNRIEDMIRENNNSYNADYKSLITQINTYSNDNRKFLWGITITILVSCVATVVAVIAGV